MCTVYCCGMYALCHAFYSTVLACACVSEAVYAPKACMLVSKQQHARTPPNAGFVADPFIWPDQDEHGKTVHMFYETKSLHSNQGDIGAAISIDSGKVGKMAGT